MGCFNKRVIGGLVVVALGVLAFAPSALSAALPVLVFAACPLSMLFMMRGVSGSAMSGGSCSTGSSARGKAGTSTAEATPISGDKSEVDQLRAEVERLRAEVRDSERDHAS